MNRKLILVGTSIYLLACGGWVVADDSHAMDPYEGSAQFEKIKSWAGTWEGTVEDQGKKNPAQVEYAVTSGGSAVIETIFKGTPHEMVSVYTEDEGKISMTHYCMLKNKPQLDLTHSSTQSMEFTLSKKLKKKMGKEHHMHELILETQGDNQLIQKWTDHKDGKRNQTTVVSLTKIQ